MPHHPPFDDSAYAKGRKAFQKGTSLRSMIEGMGPDSSADEGQGKQPKSEADYEARAKAREAKDAQDFSRLVGFADAFLDHIRKR